AATPVTGVSGVDAYHYPVTLTVVAEARLHLTLSYRPELFDAGDVARVAKRLRELLVAIGAGAGTPVGELLTQEALAVRDPRPVTVPPPDVPTLCRWAAEALDVDRVDPGDDLFDLGADSLVALRLAGR